MGERTRDGESDAQELLYTAIRNCDIKVAKEALEQGANTNLPSLKTTPLIYACYQNDEEMVRFLLGKGANPNLFIHDRYSRDLTPLVTAIEARNPKVVRALVEAGADVNCFVRSIYGAMLPILAHAAITAGYTASSGPAANICMDLLINAGANPQAAKNAIESIQNTIKVSTRQIDDRLAVLREARLYRNAAMGAQMGEMQYAQPVPQTPPVQMNPNSEQGQPPSQEAH